MFSDICKGARQWIKSSFLVHVFKMSKRSPAKEEKSELEGVTMRKSYVLRQRMLKCDDISARATKTKPPSKRATQVKKSPRKSIKLEEEKIDSDASVAGSSGIQDIEDTVWKPKNWEAVLENILGMRKIHIAPVDSMGCEQCPDPVVSPKIRRYQTLISLMLSSQTKDQVTYAAMQRLKTHGLTVDNVLLTSDEKLGELIYPVGFWRSKVKYIKKTTQILKEEYNGDIPSTIKDLCKLPGVGPKMANLAMTCGWNQTVGIAVDTHVHRISNRLGWVPKPTKDPEHTRIELEKWLPKHLWKDINLAMVGFGQTICQPTQPKCSDCLNQQLCPFSKKNPKYRNNSPSKRNKASSKI